MWSPHLILITEIKYNLACIAHKTKIYTINGLKQQPHIYIKCIKTQIY